MSIGEWGEEGKGVALSKNNKNVTPTVCHPNLNDSLTDMATDIDRVLIIKFTGMLKLARLNAKLPAFVAFSSNQM